MDAEAERCECCSFMEESTPEYITAVWAEYMGRWSCVLCAEAVGDKVRGAGFDVERNITATAWARPARKIRVGGAAGTREGRGSTRNRRVASAPALPRFAASVSRGCCLATHASPFPVCSGMAGRGRRRRVGVRARMWWRPPVARGEAG
ncbi:hypothetical protein ACQ4PT_069094 [Festuca glaucescens]